MFQMVFCFMVILETRSTSVLMGMSLCGQELFKEMISKMRACQLLTGLEENHTRTWACDILVWGGKGIGGKMGGCCRPRARRLQANAGFWKPLRRADIGLDPHWGRILRLLCSESARVGPGQQERDVAGPCWVLQAGGDGAVDRGDRVDREDMFWICCEGQANRIF